VLLDNETEYEPLVSFATVTVEPPEFALISLPPTYSFVKYPAAKAAVEVPS